MTDEVQATDEVAPEVVQPEAEQVEAPEAADSTEGQEKDQPAEAKGEQPEDEDKVSASKARRERRKAERARERAEAAELERENSRLQREIDRLKGAEKTPPPKIDDFDDHDEFIAALSAHKAGELMDSRRVADLEREAADRAERQKALQQQQMAKAQENWATQVEDAATRYADFEQVVTAPDVSITDSMVQLMQLSDVGADIAYHLGTHKEQAAALARMPVSELAGAMQMLEHFVSSNAPRPRTQSNAPQPISPVKGKATSMKAIEEMSVAEYRAAREAGKI